MLMLGFRDPPTLPLYVYRTSRDYDSRQTAHGGRAPGPGEEGIPL